jgi:hypothetical protein
VLNGLGTEKKGQDRPAPSLPRFVFAPDNIETEIQEAAARIAQQRTIRQGVDAWRLAQKSASFESWTSIGKALQIGRDVAARATGAKTGKHYARSFYAWANQHGFNGMNKEARWAAVDLVENLSAVEQWRATIPENERRRLINPLSNVRRWRRSLTSKAETDPLMKAQAAWRHFTCCMSALSQDQAAPFWQTAHEQAAIALSNQ